MKKNPPKVFTIILNFNGRETIKECLNSVLTSDYTNMEVVVVDNSSTDNSFELAKAHFPKAHFIKNEKNIGFGAGNNIGIRFALEKMADYVFLLNNDASIEKDTISKLVDSAQNEKEVGILNPLILKNDNEVWFSGGKINWKKMRTEHLYIPQKAEISSSDYATGCAMLIKKDVFREVGLFDEDYFLYYEDADLSMRAKNKGFKCAVNKTAKTFHHEKSETTNKKKIYWLVLSGLIFFHRHTPARLKSWFRLHLLLRKLKSLFKKETDLTKDIKKAFKDFNHVKKN